MQYSIHKNIQNNWKKKHKFMIYNKQYSVYNKYKV